MDPGAIRCKGDISEGEFWSPDLAIHVDGEAPHGGLGSYDRRIGGAARPLGQAPRECLRASCRRFSMKSTST